MFPEPGEGRLSPGNCVPWFKVGRGDSDQPLGSCWELVMALTLGLITRPFPCPIGHVLVLTKHMATSFPIPVAVLLLLVRVRKKNHEEEQLKAPHCNWPFLGSTCFSRPSACLRDPPSRPHAPPRGLEVWCSGAGWMITDSMETWRSIANTANN